MLNGQMCEAFESAYPIHCRIYNRRRQDMEIDELGSEDSGDTGDSDESD